MLDQEDDEVEEVMEADIVSLTLDPPPATAAAVLHQHHLHLHGHHHHGPNASQIVPENGARNLPNSSQGIKHIEGQDSNEKIALDNGGININDSSLINRNLSAQGLPHATGPKFQLQPSTNESIEVENESSKYLPDAINKIESTSDNYKMGSAIPQSLKLEVLPKKSSFSCLKSKSSDDDDAQTRTKKFVKFPEDESIVSMKVEPVNPWKDGKLFNFFNLLVDFLLLFTAFERIPPYSTIV